MAAATRAGDMSTGHDACAPTPLATASADVLIDGRGAGRVGDTYAQHGCLTHGAHQDSIISGSATVSINGRQAARVGDSVYMAGFVSSGSPTVSIGG